MDKKLGRWLGGMGGSNSPSGKPEAPAAKSPATSQPPPANAPARAQTAPAEPPREYTDEEKTLHAELKRTLEGRCDVLLRAANPETKQSDAFMVIEPLRLPDESAIRQPPIAAQRALAVARNPTSSAKQLVEIFEQDPALTEALLQMANSSFYHRGNQPVIAISGAVQRVGVRGVEAIVTTNMVEGLLCRPGSAYSQLLAQVWSHMTRTAPIARALAPAFNAAPETAFTVGLLHDVGRLMIFDYLSQMRARLRREINVPEPFLFSMLNRLHEPLGGIAALRWNLGAGIARSVAYHHHEPPPEHPDLLSELLCVAEKIDHAVRLNQPIDAWTLWRDGELTADAHAAHELMVTIPGLTLSTGGGAKPARPKAA